MPTNQARKAGRHFLQIPGPSPVPDRILKAMAMPVIDHRGPEFQQLGKRVLEKLKTIFKTAGPVFIYPASGTGAWEAAFVNLFKPGEKVLTYETGQFATLWKNLGVRLGLDVEFVETDWRAGVEVARIEERLRADKAHQIKAVCVVHNETSNGALSDVHAVRKAMDAIGHPALLLVDSVSGLGCADYQHDEWGVDVTVSGSQKGLMLPPGISFNAVSDKALAYSKAAKTHKAFWAWDEMLVLNANGFFPYTPATNLLYALDVAIDMLHEEGLDNVFARHRRHGEATRRAVKAWGLETVCQVESQHSPVLTAILMPAGQNADEFRKLVLDDFDMSLGMGLGKLAGKAFRIGHLGDINDLTLIGAIAGVEMAFARAKVPHKAGGVSAAMEYLAATR